MAFYKGNVQRSMLVDRLVQLLTTAPTGATEPYWKQVQSGTFQSEGYILHSTGKSGKENLYIRFHYTTEQHGVLMSMIEKYTPNVISGLDGTIENQSAIQGLYYAPSSSYGANYSVSYFLSFDKDKIMLVLTGDPNVRTDVLTTLGWIGLPTRLDPSDDSTAMAFAVSRYAYALTSYGSNYEGNMKQCKVVRNRRKELQPTYNMVTLGRINKTKGWGDNLLLSNIYLADDESWEGIRSIMDGIYPIFQDYTRPDFKQGDEITVGSKRYTVFMVYYETWGDANTLNCFPSQWMAVEQLS